MKYLSKEIIKNKRVILRCDFNVPVENGNICDDSKIKGSLKTINYLLNNNNTVIILSHFGRIKKEEDKKNNSLKVVYEYLKNIIDLEFIEDPLNLESIKKGSNKCYLVENTRFSDIPIKRESNNDLSLAKYWSSYADAYVIDAFASLHRLHASTAGISNYLPTYLGFLVEEELNNLEELVYNTEKPYLVIMGGAKVDDKVKLIEYILKRCDYLIITGGILNTYLKLKGYNIGKSIVTREEDVLKRFKEIINEYDSKIYYSNHLVIKRDSKILEVKCEEVKDNDLILDNIIDLKNIINSAKTIFLNGTCGKYEEEDFSRGTIKLLNDLKNSPAKVFVGGGDTSAAVKKFGFLDNLYYISSGGGATLEYVSYQKLVALEYIKEHNSTNIYTD